MVDVKHEASSDEATEGVDERDELVKEIREPLLGEGTRALRALRKETIGVGREVLAKLQTIPPPSR